ncbi:MAG: hypothetical protein ABSF63_03155 [Candidatus Bathyarchaeia archaeon]|jgi:hypothetical protein
MTNQVAVTKLQDWLRDSLGSNLSQAERERDKLVSEIKRGVDSLRGFCDQLIRKAEQDMETKRDNRAQYRASKAVARLTSIIPDMCKDFNIPTLKDSTSLRNLQRDTSKLASEAARSREEWLRQIRPYYILDMMTLGGNIDKLRRLGDELHNFLMGRGALLRSLEDVNEKIDSLNKMKQSEELAASQRKSLEGMLKETNRLDESLRLQAESVRGNPKVTRFLEVDSELRRLRGELIRTGFSRLGRPLKKLISISERGDYPLPVEVRESAKEYIRKPFTTFLAETDGYPRLKSVMSALSGGVSSGKLALKQREAKKVIERSEQVISGNSLSNIHESAKKAKLTYDQILSDQETKALVQQLTDLRKRGKENRSSQEELKAELERAIENEKHAGEQINSLLREIENFARKLSSTDLKLQLP